MAFEILLFLAGILILIKSSDLAIRYAVRLSHETGINEMAIGFILIAVGTSLPELAIAVLSSVRGEGLLSFGNVVGANVTNLTLIFGLMSMFGLRLSSRDAEKSTAAIIITTIIGLMLLALGGADLAFGLFLLIVFYAFSSMVMKEGIKIRNSSKGNKGKEKGHFDGLASRHLIYLLASIAVVVASAHLVTNSAIQIAQQLGVAQALIGATVLAIGTTLPELSVCTVAIRRRNVDLAVGNAIGSVITNITLIVGVAALINPIAIGMVSRTALVAMIAVNLIFIYFITRRTFRPLEGIVLWAIYVFYMMVMLMIGALS